MTLGQRVIEGSAGLRSWRRRYTLRRAALVAAAAGAFVTGLSATSAVLVGEADPGVVPGAPGEVVLAVSPTGFAWWSGIRPGQVVVAVSRSDEPGGWRIETRDDVGGLYTAVASSAQAGLRDSLPLAVGSLLVGALAVLFFGTRRQWVLPASAVAFVLGSTPLELQGNPTLSTFAMGGGVVLAAAWAIPKTPEQLVAAFGAVAAAAAIGYWAVARLNGLPGYAELEWLRGNAAAVGAGLLVVERGFLPRLAGEPFHVIRPRAVDVAAVALLAGVALVLVYFFSVPALVVAAVGVAGVLLLPSVRRRFRPVEDVLLADVRRDAALQGAEAERARLARELHDVPLQELLGIQRRLEVKPGVEDESDDLRAVASHLRNFAMDLRPPVLDDLGLPAGLEYLAEELSTPELPIVVELDDTTTFDRRERPPEDVELAMFRIAAEAVQNAVRHAGASSIEVRAQIRSTHVHLEVHDDGRGISSDVARGGARGKHMGIASMRRRAEAVDADFSIRPASPGTLVQAVWQA